MKINIYKFHKIEDINRDILCNNIRGTDEKEICNKIFIRYLAIEPKNLLGSVIEMISKLSIKTAIFIIIVILAIISFIVDIVIFIVQICVFGNADWFLMQTSLLFIMLVFIGKIFYLNLL